MRFAPAPVFARFLGTLTETPTSSCPPPATFGLDIADGVDDGDDEASVSGEIHVGGLDASDGDGDGHAAPAQPFTKCELTPTIRDWLVYGLGTQRGVMSAWPPAPGLNASPAMRILLLNPKLNSGRSSWWVDKLMHDTAFSLTDSYRHRSDRVVYRVGGTPESGWNFFPRGALYGMFAGAVDQFLHFGLTVTVRHFSPTDDAPTLDVQIAYRILSLFLELDAAVIGVAPPVFASMLLFDSEKDTRHVVGTVVASQLHTYRLADLLDASLALKPEDNSRYVKLQVEAATRNVFAKFARLASQKSMLKTNSCAANVVFCAVLKEGDGDDWVHEGVGVKTASHTLIDGSAFLTEYDSRFCKRITPTTYDVSSALVFMWSIFLATIRLEYGVDVAKSMLTTVLRDEAGLARAFVAITPVSANEFVRVFVQSFAHGHVERDPLPRSVLDATTRDFARLVSQDVADLCGDEDFAPFVDLAMVLVGARVQPLGLGADVESDTAGTTPTATASAAEHESLRLLQQKARVVVHAQRLARARAR